MNALAAEDFMVTENSVEENMNGIQRERGEKTHHYMLDHSLLERQNEFS